MRKLAALVLLFAGWVVYAQVIDPHNVLIQNVYIVGADGENKDKVVSILIRENKLEIVTQDEISLDDGTTALDGEGGFVVGALTIGEVPSLLILNEDPEENFSILIDSAPHVVFAINEGELVRNSLFEVQRNPYEKARDEACLLYTSPSPRDA